MSELSPLAKILMVILRLGSKVSAVLIILFAGILIYQRTTPDAHFALTRQDLTVLGLLAVLLALAFYLIRSISSEIDKH